MRPSVGPASAVCERLRDEVPVTVVAELGTVQAVEPAPRAVPAPTDVQGDILHPYAKVTHGCMVLGRLPRVPKHAAALIDRLTARVTSDDQVQSDGCKLNVAFTPTGLLHAGVSARQLEHFPKDFRDGMDVRAGLLGDVRENHPQNWRLPCANLGAFGKAVHVAMKAVQQGGTSAAYLMVVQFPTGTLSEDIYAQVINNLAMGAESSFTPKLVGVRSYDLGANCYLSKPVNLDDFVSTVQLIGSFFGCCEPGPKGEKWNLQKRTYC